MKHYKMYVYISSKRRKLQEAIVDMFPTFYPSHNTTSPAEGRRHKFEGGWEGGHCLEQTLAKHEKH